MTLDANKVIAELRERLDEFDKDPAIRQFYESTFRAWAFEVDSILIRGTGSARLTSRWRQTTKGLPYPNSLVTMGWQESVLEFMFESRLPEVRATLAAVISEIERFGLPAANDVGLIPKGKAKV
ncbi:MAG: hypothetical protein ACRD2L_25045, partial [Terriglobia bacterium]